MSLKLIKFPFLEKKYLQKKELGRGACGKTVLLLDPEIKEEFACKKYEPNPSLMLNDEEKKKLFTNFLDEIKFLYLLNHPNIVRVFNYYLKSEKYTGYIFMEYIKGTNVDDYLRQYPEKLNEIFRQTIEGFCYLEEKNIIHRDIRPGNLLVNDIGIIKIIDFGFGKKIAFGEDFDKSISLNWWCDEPPSEFKDKIYDFSTEVYFIGKLFEKIIFDHNIEHFKHNSLLKQMCNKKQDSRVTSFMEIRKKLMESKLDDIYFESWELHAYREFSDSLYNVVAKIQENAMYYDVESVQVRIEECLRNVMLEDFIPKSNLIINCFVKSGYYYKSHEGFEVATLKNFVDLFRSCGREKKNIILSNLQTKLDALPHYESEKEDLEDLPF